MDKVIEHDITEKLQKRVLTNIWGIEGNLKTKFSSEHVYMWITLWISCEFHIIFWKNLEELEEKEYTIVNNGEVPKRLKGSHSKCDRSWKRRGSSNLLFSF